MLYIMMIIWPAAASALIETIQWKFRPALSSLDR
jgi:hypothetical protein